MPRINLILAAVLGASVVLQEETPAAAASPSDDEARFPNVLFIAIDDMNDWISCLGGYNGKVHTPNIDRLVARGTLFTNAHCPSPKCAPSRAAIMTGRMPSTTGLYGNQHWWLPSLPDVVTIPVHFREQGYRTATAGKIFHSTAGSHPPNQWDEFQRQTFYEDPWHRRVKLNYPWDDHAPFPEGFPFCGFKGLGYENDWGSLPIPESGYDDSVVVEFALPRVSSVEGALISSIVRRLSPDLASVGTRDEPDASE